MSESIECDICHKKYPYTPQRYEESGETFEVVDNMPDGYLIRGMWICDECGSCPECGRSLEHEPEKWGKHTPCERCAAELQV